MSAPNMDEAAVIEYIAETFPDADVLTQDNGTYFSCDPEKHWPNFATLVRSDEFDGEMDGRGQWVQRSFSDLSRAGVYRLNIGLSKATFDAAVGRVKDPDYAALDQLIPHPVYATQHWVSILKPSRATFDSVVKPLLAKAYERVARGHRKVAGQT